MRIKKKLEHLLPWSRAGKQFSRRGILIGLALCFLLALGVRIFAWQIEPTISRDGIYYINKAEILQLDDNDPKKIELIASNDTLHFYCAYIACGAFNLSPEQLGLGTNILLGAFLPGIFFGIIWLLFKNSELALATAILAAVHPKLVEYSIVIQREMPYLFCCGLFFLFLILFFKSGKWYWSILIGLTSTMGFFFRYEGIELWVIALIVFAVYFIIDRTRRLKNLIGFAVFTAFSLLCLVGCLMVIHQSPEKIMDTMLKKTITYTRKSLYNPGTE